MIDEKVVEGLRERYANVHPLIFHRSVERAKSNGDLFDILETIPNEYPIVWDDEQHRWVKTSDLFQSKAFVTGKQ